MKKIFNVLVALCIVAALFGCGTKTTSTQDTKEQTSTNNNSQNENKNEKQEIQNFDGTWKQINSTTKTDYSKL